MRVKLARRQSRMEDVRAARSYPFPQALSCGLDLWALDREARRVRLLQTAQAADSRAMEVCVATQLLPMRDELPAAVTARVAQLLQEPHRHGEAEAALCSPTELHCPGAESAASLFFPCLSCRGWKPFDRLLEAAEEGAEVCRREMLRQRGGGDGDEQQ